MSTFGALEYDPDVSPEQGTEEAKHRLFFSEKAKFKQVVVIEDPGILTKIRLNFRLTYLKDTALARCIEDHTLQQVN